MPKYLVTGAAGFIGSHLVRALLKRGDDVRGLDNFSTGKRSNLAGVTGLDLIEGDVTDIATVERAMTGVEFVLHQAAIPSVPRSVDDPFTSHAANATGTLNVLDAARRAGTVKRLVYASSSSVYGDTPALPKVETMPTRPQSPYAVGKLTGECYALVYNRVFGLPAVALRYFNVFGPRQDPNNRYAGVIAKLTSCMLAGERPPIFGDGKQTRDFTFIDDVVEANLLACSAPEAPGQTLNIACGTMSDLLSIVALINDALGTQLDPVHYPPRKGDIRDSLADISRARSILGYAPAVTLKEGLRRYVEWFKSAQSDTPAFRRAV
jgi:nucleoside-diphosphate-sugar epimerase